MSARLTRRLLLAGLAGSAALVGACRRREDAPTAPGVANAESAGMVVNIKAAPFNATGDGKTDDTEAIQAAIDEAQASRGIVFFPAVGSSFYKTTRPLRITEPVRLVGESLFGTTINAFGLGGSQYVIDIDGDVAPNLEWVEIEGMTLMSDNGAPSLVRLNRAANCAFRNLGLRNGKHGLFITSNRCYTNLFDRVIHVVGLTGSTVRFERFAGGGQFTFTGCSFSGDTGVSLTADSEGSALAFVNCNFEKCRTNAFASTGSVKGLLFSGCRTEKCGGSYTLDINPQRGRDAFGISINGCFFETDGESAAINLGGNGGSVRGFEIRGNYAEGYTTNFVRLNGDGESGSISGNFIDRDLKAIVNAVRPNVTVTGNEHRGGKYANAGPRH